MTTPSVFTLLEDDLQQALQALHFDTPTEVQTQVIPELLQGNDLLVQAETGAGKTAAFGLPVCQKCHFDDRLPQALILAPTRELADQISEQILNFSLFRRLNCVRLVGRQPMKTQKLQCKQRVQIICGTPGRVYDHIQQGSVDLSECKMVILDEADQMFSLGLNKTVHDILDTLPENIQTCLFSATLSSEILELADLALKDPQLIQIDSPNKTNSSVQLKSCYINKDGKEQGLLEILTRYQADSTVIFCNHQVTCEQVADLLTSHGCCAAALHGGMEQDDRFRVLKQFRKGQIRCLVATDVAARGLDIDGLSLIIHWDLSNTLASFIHRCGRCGRLDQTGTSITLLEGTVQKMQYEHYLEEMELEDTCIEYEGLPVDLSGWSSANEPTEEKAADLLASKSVILIRAGRQHKVRPGDFVGALCNRGLTVDQIGTIEVLDRYTFITLINADADSLVRLETIPVKGKPRKIEKARAK